MGLSIKREKVIKELESLRDICNAKSNMAIGKGKVAWAGYANTADDAIALLKEKESEAKWIYGEDKTGVDGWHCSECDFFEPWFYEFTDDIDFIRFYGHCPGCGRKMTSYTGKQTQTRG